MDRSHAITVKYYPETGRYNHRNCIFHGEPAVTVCPNCGTLFCMDCTRFEGCPRCRTPLNFVDGTNDPEAVDDSDIIETEEQRRAIQQRWAQKRLARRSEAGSRKRTKERSIAFQSDREARAERAMKIAEVHDPPAPATPSPAPTAPRNLRPTRRGACSWSGCLGLSVSINTEEVAAPQPEPAPQLHHAARTGG